MSVKLWFDKRSTHGSSLKFRFAVNVGANVIYMAVSALLMLWYVPYLVSHLGIAAYGMVPLANSLVVYATIVTDGLNVAINRFLTIDLQRREIDAANRTFNTAFFASVGFLLILTPLILVVVWFYPHLFHVPDGREVDARVIFCAVVATFYASVVGSNFDVSSLALQRFDLRNLARGITLFSRVGGVVLLFVLFAPRLWHVGAGFAVSALVGIVASWLVWRRLTPELAIRRHAFDRSRLRSLLGMSGWSVLNRLGTFLFLSVDLIIINLYLGATNTGQYGALIFFPELLRNLIDTVSSVLNPTLVGLYAINDWEGLRQLAMRSVRLLGVGLALPVGLLCGLAAPFLTLWLGDDFRSLAPLLILMVAHMSITLATLPLSYVLTSYNRVKIQGLMTLALGVANVGLSIWFVAGLKMGLIGVALATTITFTARNFLFLSSYSAHVMEQHWWTFYPMLTIGFVNMVLVALISALFAYVGRVYLFGVESWLMLALVALLVSLLDGILAPRLFLGTAERHFLWTYLVPFVPPAWQPTVRKLYL